MTATLTEPVASANVIAYKEAIDSYRRILSEINTSRGRAFEMLDSWGAKHENRASILNNNTQHLGEYTAWITRANELTQIIFEFVAAGVDVEADEFDRAFWAYSSAIRDEELRPAREFYAAQGELINSLKKQITSKNISYGLLRNKYWNMEVGEARDAKKLQMETTAIEIADLKAQLREANNARFQEAA